MSTNYPSGDNDGIDVFNVPTLPENTPTSSAGTGNRNVVESIRDLGLAVMAIETNASFLNHDHNGTADRRHGSKLPQANTHESPDTDATPGSLHHTLGTSGGQAAAGNHTHDYAGNTILNKPFVNCVSTARPMNPIPGQVIWERDTNRMRVWAQFVGEQTATAGLYSVDDFERTSAIDMGPLWNQTYVNGATAHGVMATPDGHSLIWTPQGTTWNRCIARRTNPLDSHTVSQDQVITFNTNAHVQSWAQANPTNPTANDVYFRMSDDGQSYVRAALTWYKGSTGALMLVSTTSGPTGEQLIGQLAAQSNTPNINWQMRMIGNKFEAYMGLEYVGAITDPVGATINGHTGWGIGMQSGDYQALPNQVTEVDIAEAVYYTSSSIWQLLPVGDMPRVGLGTGRAQSINPTGSVIEWDTVGEDNFGFYHPSDKTSLIVTEPGVYFVHASIAWGTQLLGDHAATVILVNNQKTPHMHWEFVRGYDFTPGFSQTVDVTAYLRLAAGDRISIAAAHNGAAAQFTGYKKSDQITQLSRLFLTFHSA